MDIKLTDRMTALENLLAFSGAAYIEADIHLRITAWNQSANDLFGCSEDEAIGHFLDEMIPISKEELSQCQTPEKQSVSSVNQGQKIQCDITIAPIMNVKAEKLGISVLAMDISSRLKGEPDMERQQQHIREIYRVAPIGIYHVTTEGRITMANAEYAWMLGYESSEAVVNHIDNFAAQIFFDQEKAEEFMFNIFEADQVVRFRCRLKRKDNSYLWTVCYAKTTKNEFNRIDGFDGFSIDISTTIRTEQALERANEKLKRITMIDGLTQIPNRRKFDEYLASEWARHFRDKNPLSIIFCDIDFFKFYNDTYGHQAGDDCLQKVARAIHDGPRRASDMVARYGGEEFVAVLPNTNPQSAKIIAEKIRTAVRNLKIEHSRSTIDDYITLSLGISTITPESDNSIEDLIALADKAMYEAKERGRNQSVVKI